MSITYRPSLTLDEISFLLSSINWADNPDHHKLMHKLEVFTLKAKHGITKASHVRAGRVSLAAQLGMEDDDSIINLISAWESNPTALSPSQLARVQHHRYTNDMMTPEEEAAYEQAN